MTEANLTEARAIAILKAFSLYCDRQQTYQGRTLQACLKEVGLLNAAMTVCYHGRDALARTGLLADLASIFERQEAVFQELQESFALQAENVEFLCDVLKENQRHAP